MNYLFLLISDPFKSSKNLLQAELNKKLEKIKDKSFEQPKFINPKSSVITAIKKQTTELKAARAKDLIANNTDLSNLSTADTEQLMEVINQLQKQSTANKDKPPEKRMISHGKPNFVIAHTNLSKTSSEWTKENSKINANTQTQWIEQKILKKPIDSPRPVRRNESPPHPALDLQKLKIVASDSTLNPIVPPVTVYTTVMPSANNSNQFEKKQTTPPLTVSQKSFGPSVKPISPSETVSSTVKPPNSCLNLFEKFNGPPVQPQLPKTFPSASINFKTNNGLVQTKLKMLQMHETGSTAQNLMPKFSPNPNRKFDNQHIQTAVTSISVPNKEGNLEHFNSSPVSPRRAQLFKQQKNILSSQVTSPTIHHIPNSSGNPCTNNNNRAPSIPPVSVSFAKELSNAPNRYPDLVTVTKTVDSTPIDDGKQKFLSNIQFIIDSNGSVATVVQK